MELVKVKISEVVAVEVQPDEEHEWLLASKDVAEGYGLSRNGLSMVKTRNSDEIEEGVHFINVTNSDIGGRPSVYWTKEGVVMLGFFIKTPTAKEFRIWASNFIIEKQKNSATTLPTTYLEALESLVAKEKMLLEQAPQIESYKKLVQSSDKDIETLTLRGIAKHLGYAQGEFFRMLRRDGIIYQNGSIPRQGYEQYFVSDHFANDTKDGKNTYKGQSWRPTTAFTEFCLNKYGTKER